MNAIHEPLWPVSVWRVCPPYLQILLGVVKKHNDLLEDDCHNIDLQIAKEQAEMDTPEPVVNISLFDEYVSKMRRVRKLTEDNLKKKKEYKFEKKNDELQPKQKDELLKALKSTIQQQQSMINTLLEEATLHKLSGPVTSHLDKVLQDSNIKVQAFHSRSFTGNHCQKYLQEPTINELSQAVILQTTSLTSNPTIVNCARETAEKFKALNMKFSIVHTAISHSRYVPDSDLESIQATIIDYLAEYRAHYPNKMYPKLHMLEDHIIPWIRMTGFGMGLMGEQGGESAHKTFNELTRRYGGMPDPVKRLNSMMKAHLTATHPQVSQHIINPKRRKLSCQK